MSEIELGQVSLTGDADGYLSRQCPKCERIFKQYIARINADESFPLAYCPYCYQSHEGDWYTESQQGYIEAVAARAGTKWASDHFKEMLLGLSGTGLEVTLGEDDLPPEPAAAPTETVEGFSLVEVPCHPDDPFKVVSEATGEVACTICGIPYEVTDVARLGGT